MTPARPLSRDTTPEAERAWLDVLRSKPPSWRLERMMELSMQVRDMALAAFDRRHPGATPEQRRDWLLRTRYGDAVADAYWSALARRP